MRKISRRRALRGLVAAPALIFPRHSRAFVHGALNLPSIPSFAAAFGINKWQIFDGFDSISSVDVNQTDGPNFNWYTDQAANFNISFCQGTPCLPSNPAWYSASNSILTVSSNNANGQGGQNLSFAYNKNTQAITGKMPLVDGSKGFYIEGRMKFPLPTGGQDFIPDFWMQDRSGVIAQMNGTGSFRFGEIDIFEGRSNAAVGNIHDWSAWNSNTGAGSNADLTGLDYSQFHLWGVLMIPMSLNGGTGFVKWYVDRAQVGTTISWTATGQTFGVMELSQFSILFAAGVNVPLSVDYIMVNTP